MKFVFEILFYTVVIAKLQKSISLEAVARGCFVNQVSLNFSQNSPGNSCAGISFLIMLQAVASVLCQKYMKDKILTHVPAFLSSDSFLFCLLSQCFDLPFGNFILYLYYGVGTIADHGGFFEKDVLKSHLPPTHRQVLNRSIDHCIKSWRLYKK